MNRGQDLRISRLHKQRKSLANVAYHAQALHHANWILVRTAPLHDAIQRRAEQRLSWALPKLSNRMKRDLHSYSLDYACELLLEAPQPISPSPYLVDFPAAIPTDRFFKKIYVRGFPDFHEIDFVF